MNMPRFIGDPSVPLKNQRHEFFVQGLMQGLRIGPAFVAAGYNDSGADSSTVQGCQLLRKPLVSNRLSYLKTLSADESVINRTWLMAEMKATYLQAREESQLSAAISALTKLGLERGVFVEKRENVKPGDYSDMSDEELSDRIRELERRIAESEGTPTVSAGVKDTQRTLN